MAVGISNPRYHMRRWTIGSGDGAIVKTIQHMKRLVLGSEGVGSPDVRIAALEAVHGSVKNLTEIDFVLDWVKKHIEFRGENAETLQTPLVTLQVGAGDCDDHSTLIAAMLRSLGYNVQFKTVSTNAADPQFSHVYVVVQDKRTGQWKGLDSTVPQSFAGWEPPMITRARTFGLGRLGDDGDGTTDNYTADDAIDQIGAPIAQAIAARIQGNNPPVRMQQSSGSGSGSGIPGWVWLIGIGGALWWISEHQ
jgi:hypothetical protein